MEEAKQAVHEIAQGHRPARGMIKHTMKLFFCPECQDVKKLIDGGDGYRTCMCGKSAGYYHPDGLHATIEGEAIPIGFNNTLFANALANRPEEGMGEVFEAFVIPEECETIDYREEVSVG